MNNTEEQIAVTVVAGTIVIFLLIVAFTIIIVKLHKRAVKAEQNNMSAEKNVMDLTAHLVHYKAQLPEESEIMYIKYYDSFKKIEVHLRHRRLGIAVVSDVGQLNYKVRLLDELIMPEDVPAPLD